MSPPVKKKAKILKAEKVETVTIQNAENDYLEWEKLNLSQTTIKAVASMGFKCPTEIQKKTIPLSIDKQLDVLGAAETGSGKTLAFAIPIYERWLVMNMPDCLFAIVITPTRELALQVEKEIRRLVTFNPEKKMRTIALFGGLSQQKQERLLKKKPHLVVATPGRIWTLIDMNNEYLNDLSTVKFLIVDEIDRMIEKNHFKELDNIIARIHANVNNSDDHEKILPAENLQTLIFSATLTFTHLPVMRKDGTFTNKQTTQTKIKHLIDFMHLRDKRQIVDLSNKCATPSMLMECRMHCADLKQKDANLYYILNRYGKRTLIFTNSIDAVRRLYNLLNVLNFTPRPAILHAKMQERQRLKNLERFAATENSVLLATDVAARGLDIVGVETVIHYQVPRTSEIYIHRSGRTARASKSGTSILFVDPNDISYYKRIRKNLNWENDLKVLTIDSLDLMEACVYRVKLATEVESTNFNYKKLISRKNWFTQLVKEADIIPDDDLADEIADDPDELSVTSQYNQKKKKFQKALNAALKTPLPKISLPKQLTTKNESLDKLCRKKKFDK